MEGAESREKGKKYSTETGKDGSALHKNTTSKDRQKGDWDQKDQESSKTSALTITSEKEEQGREGKVETSVRRLGTIVSEIKRKANMVRKKGKHSMGAVRKQEGRRTYVRKEILGQGCSRPSPHWRGPRLRSFGLLGLRLMVGLLSRSSCREGEEGK